MSADLTPPEDYLSLEERRRIEDYDQGEYELAMNDLKQSMLDY